MEGRVDLGTAVSVQAATKAAYRSDFSLENTLPLIIIIIRNLYSAIMPLGGYIGELLTHCDLVKWVHREEIVVDTGTEKQSRDHRLLLRFEGQADYHALLREIINND